MVMSETLPQRPVIQQIIADYESAVADYRRHNPELAERVYLYADAHEYGVAWSCDEGDYTNSGPAGPSMESYQDATDAIAELARLGYPTR